MTQNSDVPVVNDKVNLVMKRALHVVYALVCVFLLYRVGLMIYTRNVESDSLKRNTACPALLSISRSSRDTLIVMQSEPLCTQFVLSNIK